MSSLKKNVCSLALVSAIALVAIAAQLANAAESCIDVPTQNDVYNPASLPYECTDTLTACADTLCECMGAHGWNKDDKECHGSITTTDCLDVDFCARIYGLCVAVAVNETNATCAGGWYNFFDEQIKEQILYPERVNTSELFDSCSGAMCKFFNVTNPDCTLDYDYVCKAPYGAENGSAIQPTFAPLSPSANAPIPTTVNGEPAVPVTRVSALVIFNGDFSAVFAAGDAAIKKLMKSVGEAFSKKFARLFLCLSVSQGSLQATVATDVPQGQTADADNVVDNIKALNSDSSTDWIASIADSCKASGGCSSGVGAPTVKLSSITKTNLAASSNPPVQQKCGTGCVAGIIIACVTVAVIITVVTVVIVKKSNAAGTGSAAANEPTEMKAAETNANAV